jgi:hypothetical protein
MMEINTKAPAFAKHQLLINAPIENIWQILTDINNWNSWNPNVSKSALQGKLAPDSIFRWKSGGITIKSIIKEVEPYQRISWTGKAIGTQAIHIWTLEPQGQGVLVETSESFDGWLVRLFKSSMQKMLDTALESWLEHLKQKAESRS